MRRIITARQQVEMLAPWRTAMPAPSPDGMTLHYHPTNETIPEGSMFRAPAVEARVNGQHVGHMHWDDEGRPAGYSGRKRKPGGIDFMWVDPAHRRKGVATAMFDFARRNDHRVRHAPKHEQTDLGRQWSDWEKSREAMLASWRLAETQYQYDEEDDYQESDNDDWKYQRWMHVSPTKMEPGTTLIPRGGPSPYGNKQLGPGHSSNVWIDSPSKMRSWFDEMSQHSPDAKFYYYDVEPGDPPEPSDWGHELGWKVPSARILHRHPDNATPDDFSDY